MLYSVRFLYAMFTICLFMFRLHTVVLSKTKSYSILFILQRDYTHIFATIYLFHKITLVDIIILWLLKLGITMLIHNKDDIQFVTEFPCLLGQPVRKRYRWRILLEIPL